MNEQIEELKERIEELEQQLAYECGCNAELVDTQLENEKIKKKLAIINRFGKFLFEPTDNNLIKVFLQVPIFNGNPNVDKPTTNFIKVEVGLITKEEYEILNI